MSKDVKGKEDRWSWGTYPRTLASSPAPMVEASFPSMTTDPEAGFRRSFIVFRRVVLPQPFGPSSVTVDPLSMDRSIPLRIRIPL